MVRTSPFIVGFNSCEGDPLVNFVQSLPSINVSIPSIVIQERAVAILMLAWAQPHTYLSNPPHGKGWLFCSSWITTRSQNTVVRTRLPCMDPWHYTELDLYSYTWWAATQPNLRQWTCALRSKFRLSKSKFFIVQVLELMQMHPKERLRRVILTASWFIAINVGQFVPENSLRFLWHILIFSWRDIVDL